jgi:hypothetical protein
MHTAMAAVVDPHTMPSMRGSCAMRAVTEASITAPGESLLK